MTGQRKLDTNVIEIATNAQVVEVGLLKKMIHYHPRLTWGRDGRDGADWLKIYELAEYKELEPRELWEISSCASAAMVKGRVPICSLYLDWGAFTWCCSEEGLHDYAKAWWELVKTGDVLKLLWQVHVEDKVEIESRVLGGRGRTARYYKDEYRKQLLEAFPEGVIRLTGAWANLDIRFKDMEVIERK